MLNPSDLPPLPIAERLLARGGDRLGSGMAEQRRRLLRLAASGRAHAVRIQSGDDTRSLFLVKMQRRGASRGIEETLDRALARCVTAELPQK